MHKRPARDRFFKSGPVPSRMDAVSARSERQIKILVRDRPERETENLTRAQPRPKRNKNFDPGPA